jgi:hypothetical protein
MTSISKAGGKFGPGYFKIRDYISARSRRLGFPRRDDPRLVAKHLVLQHVASHAMYDVSNSLWREVVGVGSGSEMWDVLPLSLATIEQAIDDLEADGDISRRRHGEIRLELIQAWRDEYRAGRRG